MESICFQWPPSAQVSMNRLYKGTPHNLDYRQHVINVSGSGNLISEKKKFQKEHKMYSVRAAKEEDCQQIMDLIMELAKHVNKPEHVKIDAQTLQRDGFSQHKVFDSYVAECSEGKLIGYALFYNTYSTWGGRSVYLEDLYVTPEWRSKGVGTKLWATVAKVAVERNCCRMDWAVMEWNKLAINFYQKHGAYNVTVADNFHMFRLTKENLEQLAILSNSSI